MIKNGISSKYLQKSILKKGEYQINKFKFSDIDYLNHLLIDGSELLVTLKWFN